MELSMLLITGLLAGFVGALFGLGGGIIIVPALTLIFDLPVREAVGTSLVSIVAVSTMSAVDYLKIGRTDLELGLMLAVSASLGAVTGGILSSAIPSSLIHLMFSAILIIAAITMAWPSRSVLIQQDYKKASNKAIGFVLSLLAGNISGILGVGGGIIQIPMMRSVMKVPMKTAAATSSFMIGITVAPAAMLYLFMGDIDPFKAAAVILGAFFGARAGIAIAISIRSGFLRILFVCLMLFTAYRMVLRGI